MQQYLPAGSSYMLDKGMILGEYSRREGLRRHGDPRLPDKHEDISAI